MRCDDEFFWQLRRLAHAYRAGSLVFVLGAGVSKPYGAPDWPTLLSRLLRESQRIPSMDRVRYDGDLLSELLTRITADPLLQGAVAKAAYDSPSAWRNALARQLHTDTTATQSQLGDGDLFTIASMLVDVYQRHPNRHISVLTFNFDSLLDQAVAAELRHRGADCDAVQTIASKPHFDQSWNDNGIYIYHLHGEAGHETISDADSYLPVLTGTHWSWACIERALTREHASSLFIGLSLTDPSLRLLLTRWKFLNMPIRGLYLAPPPSLPASRPADRRAALLAHHAIMRLYSAVLDSYHLICYQLMSWREIRAILAVIQE